MTVGNPPSGPQVYSDVSALILGVRDAFQNLINYYDWLVSLGGATYLESSPGPGIDSPDAATIMAALGNHAALNTGYIGGTPAPQLNYQANGQPFWQGQ
jgi:hypothetical protein